MINEILIFAVKVTFFTLECHIVDSLSLIYRNNNSNGSNSVCEIVEILKAKLQTFDSSFREKVIHLSHFHSFKPER